MSAVAVRPMQSEDAEGYLNVVSITYNNGNPIEEGYLVAKTHRHFVAEHEGVIKGSFNVLDLTCSRGEALLKCAGIAAVGVLPHERRAGIGNAMMSYWVRQAREEGIELASLYGFSEKYYRRFGYEVVGKRIVIKCPADRIPRVTSRLPLRQLKPTDWQLLDPCLNAFASTRSGISRRDDVLWKRVLAEHRPLTIYSAGDPVEGYAVVSHKTEFWSEDHISEVAWSSRQGYLGILELLRGLAMNKKTLTWFEPSDSPFMMEFLDTDVKTEITRPIMFRVCNVPKSLEKLVPTEGVSFAIEVRDDLIEENRGPWRVTTKDGRVSVEAAREADFSIDIRQFAQALLGDPSLADLRKAELVNVLNEEGFAQATRLLTPMPVICPEFF